MSAAPDPREDRLPKWARDQLAALRREVLDLTAHRDALHLARDPEGSTAFLDPHRHEIPLGPEPRVRFILGGFPGHDYIDVRAVDTYPSDGLPTGRALEIHGATGLVIAPRVTNVLQIGLRR